MQRIGRSDKGLILQDGMLPYIVKMTLKLLELMIQLGIDAKLLPRKERVEGGGGLLHGCKEHVMSCFIS